MSDTIFLVIGIIVTAFVMVIKCIVIAHSKEAKRRQDQLSK
jgi:hypothetical protein